MSHYFINDNNLKTAEKVFDFVLDNEFFQFKTDSGVFSKNGIDFGSYVLIKSIYKKDLGENILDLGCGYGPIGIIIQRFVNKRVTAVDINAKAVTLAKENSLRNKVVINALECDDITTLNDKFDTVIFNPPIRSGKENIFCLYEKSYAVLKNGGYLYIVIQKKQGANSSFKKLTELFKEVIILDTVKGYQIISALKG